MQPKPSRLFGRDREWQALARFAANPAPGPTLAVVRGRRRHGKSTLLRALVAAGGLYHQALEGTAAEQLRDVGRSYARHLGLPASPAFQDWQDAVDALLGLPDEGRPLLVVLDEFPYLTASSPSLPSLLQRALDERKGWGSRIRLVLCGSAMTVMSSLLAGQAPLRGRASSELPVGPFDFRQAAAFVGVEGDPRVAIQVHAVCGGVPGYYTDMLGGDVPCDAQDVDAWMIRGPLDVTTPLFHEARHLLDEETGLRDRALYLSVLRAIADGNTTSAAIARRLRREASGIAYPLSVLAELQLVVRRDDPLRARRPTWQIADPLLRFSAAVMTREWVRLEQGRAAEVWEDVKPTWRAQVLGPHFEELARTWTAEFAGPEVAGGPLRSVGTTVVSDPVERRNHEIDVVGVGAGEAAGRVLALGEAKHQQAPVGLGEMERLRRLRTLLVGRGVAAHDARLLIFSASGFTSQLEQAAEAGGVILVDPARLYGLPNAQP
jgi:AAA+ ATPase superfamily predicted ATPase